MRESKFQTHLMKELERRFPGCIVLKNDPQFRQGVPDRLILYRDKWAALELKKDAAAGHQPNQDHYVELMDSMSFAAFIHPENEEEVLDALQQSFEPPRKARIPKS